jgi:hypothetical protein
MFAGLLFAAVTIIGAGAEPTAMPAGDKGVVPVWEKALASTGRVFASGATALERDIDPNSIPFDRVPHWVASTAVTSSVFDPDF